jgi:hypothetical protein
MFAKFGTTLLFLIFLVIFLQGVRMAIRVSIPTITKVSPSLATALDAVA